ncbi:MAG: hypothetical protein MJ110_01890 [Lachnospiraceae bacterium]|nr:hypothetical protein [Lachnospiraceae bacterium]
MKKRVQTITLLLVAAALIGVGISQEQNLIVLQKAIKICLECVGIG